MRVTAEHFHLGFCLYSCRGIPHAGDSQNWLILGTRVLRTVLGGKTVYESEVVAETRSCQQMACLLAGGLLAQ